MNDIIEGSHAVVLGGAGLIGSHIIDLLIEKNIGHITCYDNFARGKSGNLAEAIKSNKVTIVEGDITDISRLADVIEQDSIVFHQAAIHLRRCENNPREAIEINEMGSFNIAEACVKKSARKLVAASTSSVYGEGVYFPTDENHPFETRLFYGASKVGAEQYYKAFREKYGLNFIGLRYLNVYGPRQDYEGAYTEVIMNMMNYIEAGKSPVIHGDGSQTLDLVYVKDVAEANIIAMGSNLNEGFFNVASGQETTVLELFNLIAKLLNVDIEPEFSHDNLKLVKRRYGCPQRAMEVLGFKISTQIEDGLREVIEWRNAVKTV